VTKFETPRVADMKFIMARLIGTGSPTQLEHGSRKEATTTATPEEIRSIAGSILCHVTIDTTREDRVRELLKGRHSRPMSKGRVRELALELIEKLYDGEYNWKGAQLEDFAVGTLAALGLDVTDGADTHKSRGPFVRPSAPAVPGVANFGKTPVKAAMGLGSCGRCKAHRGDPCRNPSNATCMPHAGRK
jgi:hypothetical protein